MKKLTILYQRTQTWNCFNQIYQENLLNKQFELTVVVLPFWLNENNLSSSISIGESAELNKKALEDLSVTNSTQYLNPRTKILGFFVLYV